MLGWTTEVREVETKQNVSTMASSIFEVQTKMQFWSLKFFTQRFCSPTQKFNGDNVVAKRILRPHHNFLSSTYYIYVPVYENLA